MLKGYIYDLATDRKKGIVAGFFKLLLMFLSFIYGIIIRILIIFCYFRRQQLNCKLISVGNITLGGTGKTSLVELIASYLQDKGFKVAVVSRGYKRPLAKSESKEDSYEIMGDEPFMLKSKLKGVQVVVDRNRARAANFAIREYKTDAVILDDGFQQWRLKKDLDVVTIDASNPFGNFKVLPRGILREPLSCLRRADVLVLTKTNLSPEIAKTKELLLRINPSCLIVEARHSPLGFYKIEDSCKTLASDALKGETVVLFSGIADPDSFENLIKGLGLRVGFSFKFPDHYHYLAQDLENIFRRAQDEGIFTVITTEKDAVRIKPYVMSAQHGKLNLLALRIQLKIVKNEERFFARLLNLFSD